MLEDREIYDSTRKEIEQAERAIQFVLFFQTISSTVSLCV
jgi:hypothetical protein